MIELKGPLFSLLLAIFLFPLAPLAHIVLMRSFKYKQKPVSFLVGGCLVYSLIWLGVNLYINGLSESLAAEMIAGFSTIFFFSLGYGEFFSMVCRGFSLRILVDIYLNKSSSFDQVTFNYGGGQGLDWMLQKRISGMGRLGMVKWEEGWLVISSDFGLRLGKFGLWFKKFLKIGLGG
jgi:hypothetical protein